MWRRPEPIGGDKSYFAPALCAVDGKLFYAVTGRNYTLHWRTFTESGNWSSITQFSKYEPNFAPALAAYQNKAWLTHVGTNGRLYHDIHDGRWYGPFSDDLVWTVEKPVASATAHSHIWRAATGLDQNLYIGASNGGKWHQAEVQRQWKATHGPALASHDGKLWIFLRATDGTLRAATRSASARSDTHYVSGQGAIKPMDEAAAASHNGKLYVMYRR
ncbi:hypothetical protein [Streptomyces sp. NPDC055287]